LPDLSAVVPPKGSLSVDLTVPSEPAAVEETASRPVDEALAEELVERARSESVGPGGLSGLTKSVLETALGAELDEHLGCPGLKWRDVDFVEGLLRVEGQLPPLKRGEAPHTVKTKSRRGVREMPSRWSLTRSRRSWRERLPRGVGSQTNFVVLTSNGRTYTRQNVSERGIEEASVRGGLGGGIRAHVLRHSFCTFLAESGIPPNEGCGARGAR